VKFVDTSFFVALQFRRDAHHGNARRIWEGQQGLILSTNHVVGETWTFLRRRLGHREALMFVDAVARSQQITIRHVEPETEDDAWRWLQRHDERAYSFVDATSFATMRRLRIREALAFDDDFESAGFVEVR